MVVMLTATMSKADRLIQLEKIHTILYDLTNKYYKEVRIKDKVCADVGVELDKKVGISLFPLAFGKETFSYVTIAYRIPHIQCPESRFTVILSCDYQKMSNVH
jgi:hypothetical protein